MQSQPREQHQDDKAQTDYPLLEQIECPEPQKVPDYAEISQLHLDQSKQSEDTGNQD